MGRNKAKGNVLDSVDEEDRALEAAAAAPLELDEATAAAALEEFERGESQTVQEVIEEFEGPDAGDDISRETPAVEYREVQISVPLEVAEPDGYVSTHVEVRLSGRQAVGLHRLWRTLNRRDERTLNGKHVQSRADAVRWLLEELAEA